MKSSKWILSGLIALSTVPYSPNTFSQNPPVTKSTEMLPLNAFVELAKMINPAVVNISTSTLPKQRRGMRDPMLDMLERFYGVPMQPQSRPQASLGTGFIIREDGLIVTNNHVIAGADLIQVQLSEKDSKLYDAKLIGSDSATDIALIKISGAKFPVAKMGTSATTEVGEWVAAFGNPFGNGHTMTKGIISAKGRDISEINRFPLLQTDAPINPGNSGGPLVNLRGEVIGVNSAIDARAQGIGFAIPIDEVKSIIPQLEKFGRIQKGFLGVGLADLNPVAAQQLGLKSDEGALIASVAKGTPAAKAGIKPYDVITEFNGKKVKSPRELSSAVADTKIGSTVPVKLIREGKDVTVNVTVTDRPDEKVAQSQKPTQLGGKEAAHGLGFTMADINENLRNTFEIPEELGDKPVIISIERGSSAAKVGLQPGDVILDVNRKEVSNVNQVNQQLKKGTNTLRVAREDGVFIVVL